MCKICKWDDWWCHTLNPILHQVYKQSYPGQFAAQTIGIWLANSSTENTPTTINHFVPMTAHSFPVPTHLISICKWFSARKMVKKAKLKPTYLYACWSYTWGTICKYENEMPKASRNAFNIGEVWNPVCCHGNKA